MAEGARLRGDDLRYIQQRDTDEHIQWLDQLLSMVEKVRSVLLEERDAFVPAPTRPPQLQKNLHAVDEKMPRIASKGPAA